MAMATVTGSQLAVEGADQIDSLPALPGDDGAVQRSAS
jgi:hypothetical protein